MEIFNKVNSFQQLIQCSMVNKRWQQLAETAIFNRDITLVTEFDAITFYNCLLRNGGKSKQPVKHLTMKPRDQPLGYFRDIIPFVVTHNMQTFNGSVNGALFFRVMLYETFGKKGVRRFRNLKTIPSAWTYCNIYDSLLYRLRNILQEITLNFRGIYYDPVPKWRVLSRLNKITGLQALNFNSYVHDVEDMETILQNCGHIKRLTIRLAVEDLFCGETDIDQWIKINTHQCDTLGELKIRIDKAYNPYFIDYVMYKYPNIESIIVEKIDIKEPWGSYPVDSMDISSIRSVLDKIQRVPKYTLKCNVCNSEEDDIISFLKSDGYTVYKYDQHCFTSVVTATGSNSNDSNQSSTSRSSVLPAPLRMRYPSATTDRFFEW